MVPFKGRPMPYNRMGEDEYQCKDCGRVYYISSHHVPTRDKDEERCPKCDTLMVRWNGSRTYSLRLVKETPLGWIPPNRV